MDIKDTPVISFITICYNGLADTCALIESLYNVIHSVSYEIIVVDNASSQDEAAVIKSRYPWVTTIRSQQNSGFSGGNNLGIKAATGQYIFLINNDTYLMEDGLPTLIARIESQPENWCRISQNTFCFYSTTHSVCRFHSIKHHHIAK